MNRGALALAFAAMLVALATLAAPPAQAASERQIRQKIEKQFGVRVLKARQARFGGRAAYILTVMKPGGASNSAFQITELAVDSDSGRLIPVFRHGVSGLQNNQSPIFSPNRQTTQGLREGLVWR